MEIVYDKSTGTWSEREEPYTTLDVQTEEDWNKLEFMINNFSRLEEENAELKRLLRLAVEGIERIGKWKHAEEALKLLGDDADGKNKR